MKNANYLSMYFTSDSNKSVDGNGLGCGESTEIFPYRKNMWNQKYIMSNISKFRENIIIWHTSLTLTSVTTTNPIMLLTISSSLLCENEIAKIWFNRSFGVRPKKNKLAIHFADQGHKIFYRKVEILSKKYLIK